MEKFFSRIFETMTLIPAGNYLVRRDMATQTIQFFTQILTKYSKFGIKMLVFICSNDIYTFQMHIFKNKEYT